MSSNDRDKWLEDRGFIVEHCTGSEIWMRPDEVLGRIARRISAFVPMPILPSPVPLGYLARDCAAALPLLLRRGRKSIPLLSLQSSVLLPPTQAAKQWLGIENTRLPTSEAPLLISGTMRNALTVTIRDAENQAVEHRARSSLIAGNLPDQLDGNWLEYLRWREEDPNHRAAIFRQIRQRSIDMSRLLA